jgi:hypothetical protein
MVAANWSIAIHLIRVLSASAFPSCVTRPAREQDPQDGVRDSFKDGRKDSFKGRASASSSAAMQKPASIVAAGTWALEQLLDGISTEELLAAHRKR